MDVNIGDDVKYKHAIKNANKKRMFEGVHSIRERRSAFPQQLGKSRI